MIFSLGGLIMLSPVFVLLVCILFVANSGKVFFIQRRPGKDARIFSLIKFKTMNDRSDAVTGQLLPDMQRITGIGRFLRDTSLDELPQLINVLRGEMSLIGPRPLLVEYLPMYSARQSRRHDIRPGLSGWAQVNGRNAISWQQKFDYDVWYVEHLSFCLDLKIVRMTLQKLFRREGINASEEETMEKLGTKSDALRTKNEA
jgi:lipopolysaccharide/colanic/teichoic acid biosynthesis glycosyltransferase